MQNGTDLSKLLQGLRDTDEQWETLFLNDEEIENKDIEKKIRWLLSILRQELKTEEDKEVQEFLKAENVQKEAAERLVERAQSMLQLYSGFALFRELESKNEMELKGLLSIIYQKYIVRFEPSYLKQIKTEAYDGAKIVALAEQIDFLTDFYVSKSYTVQRMKEDLMDETGLSAENCEYWAGLIEENYMALKMNHIVESLERIQEKLASTTEL